MQFVIIAVYDYVYWGHTDGIGRVRTDGTDIKPKFITGVKEVRAIAVHADKIYFSHSKGIGRADLDGDNVEADFIPTNGLQTQSLCTATAREISSSGVRRAASAASSPRWTH